MGVLLTCIAVIFALFGGAGLMAPRIYDEKTAIEIIVFIAMLMGGMAYLIIY